MLSPYGAGCYDVDGDTALVYVRSRKLQISDPDGEYVDPETGEHWRSLDVRSDLDRIARQQTFIRKLAGLAISHAPGRPVPGGVAGRQRARVHPRRPEPEPRRRERARARVPHRRRERPQLGAVRDAAGGAVPARSEPAHRVPDADAVVQQLRTFGDDTPKPATVLPSQVKVRVVDATGTNVGASVVKALADQGFQATQAKTQATIPVTEIRYGYGQSEEAHRSPALLPRRQARARSRREGLGQLALGTSFGGTIFVPPTTTTLPGTPVTSAPPSPTTTIGPAPSDPCSQ